MPDALLQAIRERNLHRAQATIAQLQEHMSSERIAGLIVAAIEKLAWEEGDRIAALWLLKRTQTRSARDQRDFGNHRAPGREHRHGRRTATAPH
jgi:hypothetical protein